MMCLYSDVPLGRARHSDLMIYDPKGSLGLLKQILRYRMSLNVYICSVIAKQLEYYNDVFQISS